MEVSKIGCITKGIGNSRREFSAEKTFLLTFLRSYEKYHNGIEKKKGLTEEERR
jgi:hypothetical protein